MDSLNNSLRADKVVEVPVHGSALYIFEASETSQPVPLHFLINDALPEGQYLSPFVQTLHEEQVQIMSQISIECKEVKPLQDTSLLSKTLSCQILNPVDHKAIIPIKSVENKKTSNRKNIKNSMKTMDVCQAQQEKELKVNSNCKIVNYVHLFDRVVSPRAIAVLPAGLKIHRNSIFPRRSLPASIRFGPVQGVICKMFLAEANTLIAEAAAHYTPIFLSKRDEDSVSQIDVSDKDKSNWFGLLPLGDQTTANVWLYEEDGELYGITTKHIATGTPLSLGYSKNYAREYRLPPGQPIIDIVEELQVEQKQLWCSECHVKLESFPLLQKHMDIHHKDNRPTRRRYRCSNCTRTFTRLFTLRRHTRRFCTKKPQNPDQTTTPDHTEEIIDSRSCSTPNVEDNRLPSDESFQNYTNGLDFSTNLFDTDRIPNLDISGSSRSEAEFNPYVGEFKEDKCLSKEAEYPESSTTKNYNKDQKKLIWITCPHCNQSVAKEKNRQHLRECSSRRLHCKCGLTFNHKNRLGEHLHAKHFVGQMSTTLEKSSLKEPSETNFKCEDCKQSFKRRGMFVNHLWRVHKRSASVPLVRRVRHYPCVACTNVYRTAAKRDLHVRRHHPGAELHRAAPIEGEGRACQPASCPVCPRQYVTRAKLLQHLRKSHPHVAVPVKSNTTLKSSSTKTKHINKPTSTHASNR